MTESELVPVTPQELPTVYSLGAMSIQQLRGELARSLTMTAQHLAYLASIWHELERRGEDLSDLRTGLAVYLPRIAAGQLSADAVLRFAGQPTVLRNVATLPIDMQMHLAKGGPVRVLTATQSGDYDSLEIPASAMTAAQARLLITDGKIRSPEEQRAQLETARLNAARRSRPGPMSRVRYDAKSDKIRVGSTSASVGEIINAVAAASTPPAADADLASTVMIKITESEHKALKIRAAQAGKSVQEYARSVLVMQSLL